MEDDSGAQTSVDIATPSAYLVVLRSLPINGIRKDPAASTIHVGTGATADVVTFGPHGLHRIHFPTKQIDLADVLRLAIIEFGVEPRRADWERILDQE